MAARDKKRNPRPARSLSTARVTCETRPAFDARGFGRLEVPHRAFPLPLQDPCYRSFLFSLHDQQIISFANTQPFPNCKFNCSRLIGILMLCGSWASQPLPVACKPRLMTCRQVSLYPCTLTFVSVSSTAKSLVANVCISSDLSGILVFRRNSTSSSSCCFSGRAGSHPVMVNERT